MLTLSPGGFKDRLSRSLQNRYAAYILFIIIMLIKLVLMHYNLQVKNIDMNPVDYIIAIGSLILVSFWTFWLPMRGRLSALMLLNLILTGIIYADLVFYRYFEDFITVPILMQAGQVGSLGESIRSLIHWRDLFFFIDWIVLVPLTVSLFFRKRRVRGYMEGPIFGTTSRRKVAVRRFITGTIALLLGFVLTFVPIKKISKTWAVGLFESNWWNVTLYNVTGLIGFHGYDIYRYAKDHLGLQPVLDQEEVDQNRKWFDKQAELSTTNATFGKYQGSNVIMIQVEAFMNFIVNQTINGQEITPNFNKLINESMYYSNFYHQTALGRTSDADFVTQSSLLPLPAGSVFTRYPLHEYDTIPTILKEHGYAANVYHSYDSSFWNRHTVYKEMNYDRYYSKKDFEQDEMIGWSVSDESFFKQSLNMMKDVPEPFYSFLITLTSHHPYALPKERQQLDTGEFQGTMFGDYLQSMHYVDQALGKFVEQMKTQGLWDSSILIIYGDHDNSIKDKAMYEQFMDRPLNDLDMEQIMNQVPLLIHLPDGGSAGVYPEAAGMMNTAPTIYHLLGISPEPYYLMGDSLLGDQKRLIPLRSRVFSDNEVFYIPAETGSFENGTCYNLSTRQPTDINACRQGHEETNKLLKISDQVITYDLLKQYKASPRDKK
ncbi:Phosphoglycerol transferase MdoB [Paenibacillus uliginis N3/975]|uniref:Phosphoglycerol transferase MdoB n=1 Tax=Paenibacillus uliginis N3/975 TaxID=1313296 RepID=A0A1X7H1H1_9BACL|nr:LTA synthase family protein [Paenibacillus uliginis]SMF78171.1 Phosphoglycerol transferase MdoB [Paenibacillus uliginis N3/975]